MGTTNTGPLVFKAFMMFEEFGRITASEFADYADISRYDAHAVLYRLNKRMRNGVKRIHIAAWVDSHDDARRYLRAQYELGDKPDKARPQAKVSVVRDRYHKSVMTRFRMNNVFNMALTREQVRENLKLLNTKDF